MKAQNRTIKIAGGYAFDEKNHLHTLNGKPLTGVTTVLSVIAKPALIQWAANMACDYMFERIKETSEIIDGDYIKLYGDQLAGIIENARKAHKKKKESAGTHGTEVHSEIENIINEAIKGDGTIQNWKGSYVIDNKAKGIIQFITWAQLNKVKFLASEKHVYSKSMWVGGICDIVCEIDGKRFVGDIKTSSAIYPEHFIQASAYAEMLTDMGETPKECLSGCGCANETSYHEGAQCNFQSVNFDGVVIINLDKKGGFDVKFNYDLEGNLNCFKAALTLYRHLIEVKNQSL